MTREDWGPLLVGFGSALIALGIVLYLMLVMTPVAIAAVPSNVAKPPARYDHSFKGRLQVMEVSRPWLVYYCGPMAQACAPVGGEKPGLCTIVVPKLGTRFIEGKVDLDGWKSIYKHERAHCNGWPANHPR